MKFGKLDFENAADQPSLFALPTYMAITSLNLDNVWVSEINAELADTAAFCEAYDVGMDVSANCVIVEAKRADKVWHAACMILATDKADVNNTVRRMLNARKISFASMDTATTLTKMEYGGITPIGLPEDWPIIVDEAILKKEQVIIGSGIRGSKILINSSVLEQLPNISIANIVKDN